MENIYLKAYDQASILANRLHKSKKQQIRNRMNELKKHIQKFEVWDNFMEYGSPEEPTEAFYLKFFGDDWTQKNTCCKFSDTNCCLKKENCKNFSESIYYHEYCKWERFCADEDWDRIRFFYLLSAIIEYYKLWDKLGQRQ